MTDPLAPMALLCGAVALALSFLPRATALRLAALFILVTIATALLPLDPSAGAAAYYGCWASVILCGIMVHWAAARRTSLVTIIVLGAGLCCGFLAGIDDGFGRLAIALPFLLLYIPGAWIVRRGYQVVLKVVASWLIAIGLLLIALPLLTTPGYQQDHRD